MLLFPKTAGDLNSAFVYLFVRKGEQKWLKDRNFTLPEWEPQRSEIYVGS